MALSRPLLLALLGAALLGITFFAVQNARTTTQNAAAPAPGVAAPPAVQPAEEVASTKPAEPKALAVEDALKAIVSPGAPLTSGQLDLIVATQEQGAGRPVTLKVQGSFQRGEANAAPQFSFRVEGETGRGQDRRRADQTREVVLTPDKAYVGVGDSLHAIADEDFQTLGQAASAFQLAGPEAPVDAFDSAKWVSKPRVVGVEAMDGVQATHVTGDLAADAVATEIVRLVRAEASESAAKAGLPAGTVKLARRAVLGSQVDVWVGPDRIMRRLTVSVDLKLPKPFLDAGDPARGEMSVDIKLTDVNKPQKIAPPADRVSPAPPERAIGRNDTDNAKNLLLVAGYLVAPEADLATKTFTMLSMIRQNAQGNTARKVRAAVDSRRKVVVLFQNPRGLDDRATARSVRALKGDVKAALFVDDVANVASYGALGLSLGVSQAPSTVIIDRKGSARVIEGFVDTGTLRQALADAR